MFLIRTFLLLLLATGASAQFSLGSLSMAQSPQTASKPEIKEQTKEVDESSKSPPGCELCLRPDVQGQDASPTYQGDFKGFCNKCGMKKKDSEFKVPDPLSSLAVSNKVEKTEAVEKQTKDVDESGKSPSGCELCKRPDVQGPTASVTYSNDFSGFCSKCAKEEAKKAKEDDHGKDDTTLIVKEAKVPKVSVVAAPAWLFFGLFVGVAGIFGSSLRVAKRSPQANLAQAPLLSTVEGNTV